MTCPNKKMVGISVTTDGTYLNAHRVNRLNLLLETVQDAYCNVATEMLKNDAVDRLFPPDVPDLDCKEVLASMKDGYYQIMSKQGDSPYHDILKPAVAVGYELFTGMVKDACVQDNKFTREQMVQATEALIRAVCNAD